MIDLVLDDEKDKIVTTEPKANDKSSAPEPSVTTTSDEQSKQSETPSSPADKELKDAPKNTTTSDNDDDEQIEDLLPKRSDSNDAQPPNQPEELSDDDEIVLDPLSGEFCRKLDIQRRQNRALLLGSNEEDDDEEVLDPLTGQFRRKGDVTEAAYSDVEPGTDETTQQSKSEEDIPNEDFEELLKAAIGGKEADIKKSRKMNPKSLAALKHEISFYRQLQKADTGRNFDVLPQEDETCWIRFNQFTYQLDKIGDIFSVWKCNLSPQYACRGKIHLNASCDAIAAIKVNHCHAASIEDMFLARLQQEEGHILDSDLNAQRQYTFYKRPKNVFLMKLDDGYFYSCLTISKTQISSWRCAQRRTYGCKAILTMEGNFRSMTRNRFSHSHDQPVGEPNESEKDRLADNFGDMAKEKDTDKKNKKRQTL